ncbi:MAG: hypothetical protein ABIH21_04715 [Patescibacteria group bacterium]
MKRIIILVSLIALVAVSPLASVTQANDSGWVPTTATEAWDHGEYRIEKLAFDQDVIGPFSLGENVFVAEPIDSCRPNFCNRYDLYKLQNGMKLFLGNVPKSALDKNNFALNDNRLVYANAIDLDNNHYSVVERDLEDGSTKILIEDAFFNSAEDVGVMVEGAYIYLNPEFNFQNTGSTTVKYKQATTYAWDPEYTVARVVGGRRWTLRREEIKDVYEGMLLVKMVFQTGHQELWLVDSTINKMEPVPGSWVEPNGNIVGAHFQEDGTIEYFAYYVRYTYRPEIDKTVQKHAGQLLSWYRDTDDAIQISGNRMAWIDAEDNLYVSQGETVQKYGTVPFGRFRLEGDSLSFASNPSIQLAANGVLTSQGKLVDLDSNTQNNLTFAVTDSYENMAVGIDNTNYVWYYNLETGKSLRLGYGSESLISDARHVYWRGNDGIYEATIEPTAHSMFNSSVRPIKTANNTAVYLTDGQSKWKLLNESEYLSWFGSFDQIVIVDQYAMDSLKDAGKAAFAPGARVKQVGNAKVYVVGADNKLHWIINQRVAFEVYGEAWNKGILEVPLVDLVPYPFGGDITAEVDMQGI